MTVMNQKTLHVSSGESYFVEMEFANDENRKQSFSVKIQDEDLKEGFIQT